MRELKIEGYASMFGTFDSDADMVEKGAFKQSLEAFHPVMLWNHDPNTPTGRWGVVEERELGLWVEGVLLHEETIHKVENRMVSGLSIGYRTEKSENLRNGGRKLLRVELVEVSIVAVPMHKQCLLAVT